MIENTVGADADEITTTIQATNSTSPVAEETIVETKDMEVIAMVVEMMKEEVITTAPVEDTEGMKVMVAVDQSAGMIMAVTNTAARKSNTGADKMVEDMEVDQTKEDTVVDMKREDMTKEVMEADRTKDDMSNALMKAVAVMGMEVGRIRVMEDMVVAPAAVATRLRMNTLDKLHSTQPAIDPASRTCSLLPCPS